MAIDFKRIHVIDSHTGGEPTRVVMSGGPELGSDHLATRLERFRSEFDSLRSAVVNEPRGSDAMVGALLCKPVDPTCAAGVIFFNNVGYLGMCGHGTVGLMVTLAHAGLISAGTHRIETPCGIVTATLEDNNTVSVRNVPSYRTAAGITVNVRGIGPVTGDIAWGGNWFFLVANHGQELSLSNVESLTDFTWRTREALNRESIRGDDGHEIDHIELFGPPHSPKADSRNFVLCPGKAYDRSPCGTGTSAKVACLIADGKLQPGEWWRQESIVGSIFEACGTIEGDKIIPTVRGSAYITSEGTLLLQDEDPLRTGIR